MVMSLLARFNSLPVNDLLRLFRDTKVNINELKDKQIDNDNNNNRK